MLKRTCVQCGKEFEMNQSEISFYKKKKLSLPKRCKECRELNKAKKNGKQNEQDEKSEYNKKNTGSNAKKDKQSCLSFCFVYGFLCSAKVFMFNYTPFVFAFIFY